MVYCCLQGQCGRIIILGDLRSVRVLNGTAVSEEEATTALKQMATSHLTLTTLMNQAHSHPEAPNTLTLSSVARILHRDHQHRLSHLRPQDNWTQLVS